MPGAVREEADIVQPVKRRTLLLGVGALMSARLGVSQAPRLPSIVVLSLAAPEDHMRALEEGLRARGWIHGSTANLTHLTAGGRNDALLRLAADAVSASPDVIVAVGAKAAEAAQQSTRAIPIVVVTGDMVAAGLVRNMSQPEGNVTGFSFFNADLPTKRLALLLEVNPSLRRLTILMYGRRTGTQVQALSVLDGFLKGKGITAEVVQVAHFDALEAVIASIPSSPEESVLLMPSPVFDAHAKEIGASLAKRGVIAMLPWKAYVEAGGVMSYAPDIIAIWRDAGTYVDRILRGAKPGDLPVSFPNSFELVVNLRSAQALSLSVPAAVLLRADHIIE